MLIVALTGGIGSGKSTVGELFQQLGAVVVDSDQLAREVVERGSSGFDQIVSLFGNENKIYSDPEVEMIKKIINTSFQDLNKQTNSQDKNQYRKLLLKIKNKVEKNPEIQNQQQILNGINTLNKKVNTISVPRSKH